MTNRSFHTKPFAPHTLSKLRLFRSYLESWMGVWLKEAYRGLIICDPFAGSGGDNIGNPGSPMIISETIEKFRSELESRKGSVVVFLNDSVRRKATALSQTFRSDSLVEYRITNEDFAKPLDEAITRCRATGSPSLVFLDQFGWKALTGDRFLSLSELKRSDLLFFVASSAVHRFKDVYPFDERLGIDFSNVDRQHPIRTVQRAYQKLAETSGLSNLLMGTFELISDRNRYGLVFATKSRIGLEKFVNAAWKEDPHGGGGEYARRADELELEYEAPSVQFFNTELEGHIAAIRRITLRQVADYALLRGMRPTVHAKRVLQTLRNDGKITILPEPKTIALSQSSLNDGRPDSMVVWRDEGFGH